VLALEIALDRTLAAIGRMEIGGAEIAVLALDERRAPGARVVAGLAALDLDDVGAEIGEHLSGPRPRKDAGQFQDANARQWTWLGTGHWAASPQQVAAKWAASFALCGLRSGVCL